MEASIALHRRVAGHDLTGCEFGLKPDAMNGAPARTGNAVHRNYESDGKH